MSFHVSRRKQPAFAYVRVSTAEQAEHVTSLEQQAADLAAFCGKNGLELVEVLEEPGLSVP